MRNRTITSAVIAAALLGAGATAAQAAEVCHSVQVPAVPAVYETVIIPAVTVTEYEFTHAQDGNGNGQGQGPANRWEASPDWNAESNPNSVGWVATGASRVRVVEVEKSIVKLVTPEIPASSYEECATLPDGLPDQRPVEEIPAPAAPSIPEAPAAPVAPPAVAPAPAIQPVTVQAPEVPVAAPVAVIPAQPVAAAQEAPEELAYTGAADWVLPAGLALVLMGAAAVASRRFITIK